MIHLRVKPQVGRPYEVRLAYDRLTAAAAIAARDVEAVGAAVVMHPATGAAYQVTGAGKQTQAHKIS